MTPGAGVPVYLSAAAGDHEGHGAAPGLQVCCTPACLLWWQRVSGEPLAPTISGDTRPVGQRT